MRAFSRFLLLLLMAAAAFAQKQAPPPPRTPQAYTLTPARRAQAIAYARARNSMYFLSTATTLLVLGAILWSRVAGRLRAWSVPSVLVALSLADLLWDVWAHHLSLRYAQSVEAWNAWFWDWTKGQLIVIPVASLLLWGLYALLRRAPTRWWLWAWLASIPLSVASVYVEPLVIAPLFNRFEPLAATHPSLVGQMEAILGRARVYIPRDRLFEMKASEKTNVLNAYVAGFGPSKRVVLYDTIIARETPAQLMTTFGHELGHYALDHVAVGLAFGAAISLLGLFAADRLMRFSIARWGARLSIASISDWASLPLLLLLFAAGAFLADPIVNGFSRWQEQQADVYSLEVTHGIVPDSSAAAAQAFQIEGDADLSDPDPPRFIQFWLYSHPPTAERLRFALHYDPWSTGHAPRFVN